ncbi:MULTISPECIES: hypothetical protein [Fischerella]|uniref:Uncharacterized protein n=1 Tax=Fischerella muscicola CCMEE 5323 TaxID=2019572 RepID=A0A2N6JX50_FISMU|nr:MULTISPECIES: hypothetical protein [Fischerella]MBD2432305.1 hypothetical protein [Fischerella sp. FACHB-380]PLZ84842.1 hypothetical protein CEN44_23650 [Fischerella muscicola CCMEE 5323]
MKGFRRSAINSLKSGLIFGTIGILLFGLFFGIGLGLFIWFQLGGLACIQHLVLRLVLVLNGYTPLHYANFLNYCKELLLLQQVGGRYRFIHRLLQEHFAAMPLEK